jgi:hypothetical protein
MVVTILAAAFLVLIGFIAFVGYRSIISKQASEIAPDTERCSICRERFDKHALVERQIGDYRLLYFCRTCILGLYGDLGIKN